MPFFFPDTLVSLLYWLHMFLFPFCYSYVDVDGKKLVASDDMSNDVELGNGGSELIITQRTDDKISTKALGSREYLRYYRQKPRPSHANDIAISVALASRFAFYLLYWSSVIEMHSFDFALSPL